MRPKETYTKEEYSKLNYEIVNLKEKLRIAEEKLKQEQYINKLMQQHDNGESYKTIRQIIAEEIDRQRINELLVKYPYYKDIKEYVDMGIIDKKQLAHLTGKSVATVYRALHDMGMFPTGKRDLGNSRLSI